MSNINPDEQKKLNENELEQPTGGIWFKPATTEGSPRPPQAVWIGGSIQPPTHDGQIRDIDLVTKMQSDQN